MLAAVPPPPKDEGVSVPLVVAVPRKTGSYELDPEGLALRDLKEGLELHVLRKLLMVMCSDDKDGSIRVYIKNRRIVGAAATID